MDTVNFPKPMIRCHFQMERKVVAAPSSPKHLAYFAFQMPVWPNDGVSSHASGPHMGSPVPRHWYLMKLVLQTSWVQRGTGPIPISSQVLVVPGAWCRAVRAARGTNLRGRRQLWLGMFCMAEGAHPWESVVWGLPGELAGGCGQAGDRKRSSEDLGHHLVASLTAYPKSLSHRVTVLHGQRLKKH